MAVLQKFQIVQVKESVDRNDHMSYVFLEAKEAPRYSNSYDDAQIWIKEKGDNRKTYSIIEVFLDERYL